eukprot:scaffold264692_cov19-Tisochrysis_lutea.AAC.1
MAAYMAAVYSGAPRLNRSPSDSLSRCCTVAFAACTSGLGFSLDHGAHEKRIGNNKQCKAVEQSLHHAPCICLGPMLSFSFMLHAPFAMSALSIA